MNMASGNVTNRLHVRRRRYDRIMAGTWRGRLIPFGRGIGLGADNAPAE